MKRYLLAFIVLAIFSLFSTKILAQSGPYGNEWIDYTKTYYKFKVGKNGVCRISKSALTTAGVPGSVTGSNFILFRDGKEVPIFLSGDVMGSGDYIEFYGMKANGNLDKELFSSPAFQSNDRISLFADTACYFLTYDNGTNHLRYSPNANSIPSGSLTPEPFCLNTVGFYPKSTWLAGPSLTNTDELTSSLFESGEGYVDVFQGINSPLSTTLTTPNLVAGQPATLHTSIISRSYDNAHEVKLLVNSVQLADSTFGIAECKHYDITVPSALLSSNNQIGFVAVPQAGGTYDGYGLSFAELEYPRNFDLSGIDQIYLKLPATGAAQYLEFSNIGAAKLYDMDAKMYYIGDLAIPGKTRFYLDPATATRRFVIVSNTASSILSLNSVKSIQFTNYTNSAAQGDFLIITHNAYMQPVGGRNYVQEYLDYRKSAIGGGHAAVAADVTELYDQFAYGNDIHPLSIKHFLKFALDSWVKKPADVLIIGKGIFYNEYPKYLASISSGLYPYPVVPTYGNPGSDVDFVMFGDQTPKTRLGRLPAWSAQEIGIYLDKLKAYEMTLLSPAAPTEASELWKKRVLHAIGSGDASLQPQLLAKMNEASLILKDTLTGMSTTTIVKSSSAAIQQANGAILDSILKNGSSLITFYGHGSQNAFDYNLPDPATYINTPHIPFITALGCDVSQYFTLSPQKFLAERYIFAPNSGSVGFLATDNLSYINFDDSYLLYYYNSIASVNYGAAMGDHYNYAHNSSVSTGIPVPNFNSVQLESMVFSGDPSIKLPSVQMPDYEVSADGINTIPGNVTGTLDSFTLRIKTYNLGKAISDTVSVKVEQIHPKGNTTLIGNYLVYSLRNSDTTNLKVPIDSREDNGLNKIRVTVDALNKYNEISELNNVAMFNMFIYSDILIPVYPKEFAIVNKQGITLKASTLNPFRPLVRCRIEMDTTELFNSPSKQQTIITGNGGLIKWTPTNPMTDSVVYYWRAAFDTQVNGNYVWTNSSFIYLQNGTPGWNQSHYFQYGKDNSASMTLFNGRRFGFNNIAHKLQCDNTVIGASGNQNADGVYVRTYWDDVRIEQSSYFGAYHALHVTVIDSASGRIYMNSANDTHGAYPPAGSRNGLFSRQFNTDDPISRAYAAKFIDSVPNGNYILIRNVIWDSSWQLNMYPPKMVNDWKADSTAAGGIGKTLYGVLKNNGFNIIDSFNRVRVFVFMRRKGDPSYPVYQAITDAKTDHIGSTWVVNGSDIKGSWNSTIIGPSTDWQSLKWKTSAYDTLQQNDTASLKVIGISPAGVESIIYPIVIGDTSLAGISANQYPYLKLVWFSKDSVNTSSTQLNFWRVLYTPVPEAALNPAIHYVFNDSLSQGQMQTFSTAIENLTDLPMDSMLVRYKVIGADGVTRPLADKRYRKLPGLDTLNASITFDPSIYPGKNLLFIEANPDNDQLEEYHPNNLGYIPFKISVDAYNPLLDVTFDGMHILNGDIVSAKPFIKIKLKDENQFLKLDDTSLLKVYVRTPGSLTPAQVPIDGNICRFIPATSGGKGNEAVIEYRPIFTQDGIYQLSASGADKSGNGAGAVAGSNSKSTYFIEFEVDNKASITHVLNYPNPFSTATAFVFTLTGSQIPSQLKIQILSVTGKVVREITRGELGPLHIGRNITEYQWDGRDQFGQLLGNGVYLYRVVTSMNGSDLDLRTDAMNTTGNGIDKYFKNGYGKMYIMR